MKTAITFELDRTALFDTLHDAKDRDGLWDALGRRLVGVLLAPNMGLLDQVGLAFYGITVSHEERP